MESLAAPAARTRALAVARIPAGDDAPSRQQHPIFAETGFLLPQARLVYRLAR
jgi:hypothetical protein